MYTSSGGRDFGSRYNCHERGKHRRCFPAPSCSCTLYPTCRRHHPPPVAHNSTLLRLAEAVFGGLQSTSHGAHAAPIHLTFERLYLGFLPSTALNLLPPLLAMLALAYFFIIPTLHTLIPPRTPTIPRAPLPNRAKNNQLQVKAYSPP